MTIQAGFCMFNGQPLDQNIFRDFGREVADQDNTVREDMCLGENWGMLCQPCHTTSEFDNVRQPYVFAAGKMVTWDGRLDNREELITLLGEDLRGRADIAIVAAALKRWDTASFVRLVGDWALAVWDPANQELILARDYIGVRRLFYYLKADKVIWCSDLSPLALCGDHFTLSDQYLAGYLSYFPEGHLTPYSEILAVPPGSYVCISKGRATPHLYWRFAPSPKAPCLNDSEYEEVFRDLFRESVKCRLRTKSPILADLSGGIDSSSVVCMADEIVGKESCAGFPVHTFSFFDSDEPDECDVHYFKTVEAHRGVVGYHAELRALGDSFSLEQGQFNPFPGFGIRRELSAAKSTVVKDGGYRVLLSGNGGDQMLGQGLDPHVAIANALVRGHISQFFSELVEWSLLTREPVSSLLAGSVSVVMPQIIRRRITGIARELPWLDSIFMRRFEVPDQLLPANAGSFWWPTIGRHNFQTLQRLRGEMTQSATSNEEIRYPFLDRRLVEFLFSVPPDQFVRNGQRRSLIRRSLQGIVPAENLARRTKSGTGRCHILTVMKHWDEIARMLKSAMVVDLGYVNRAAFSAVLADVRNGKMPGCIGQLLRTLALEVWIRDVTARGILSLPAQQKMTTGRFSKWRIHAVAADR